MVLLAAVSSAARAQVIQGTLVDHAGGAAIARGTVALLDSAARQLSSTQADDRGAFALRAPAAGTYILYFSQPGYASVPSDWIRLRAGETREFTFRVPLISGAAVRRMSEVIQLESRLQSNYAEMCGEPIDPNGTGILVGVVRRRPGGEPVPGAVVHVEAQSRADSAALHRATASSANGVYIMCNLPAGELTARTHAAGFRIDEGPVTIRAGEVAWYDVQLRRR